MAVSRRFRTAPVILALLAASPSFSVFTAQAAPPPESPAASGGVVPQSGNCSSARPDDEQCLPGGPPGSTQPGGPILPPTPPPIVPIPLAPGRQAGPPPHPHLPAFISGKATATLHIKDDVQDVTYVGASDNLVFMQRSVQDMEGNTQYVWAPVDDGTGIATGLVRWKAKGTTVDGCTVEGRTTVRPTLISIDFGRNFPGYNSPLDPTVPAYGYLNVVGPDGGDFYSVMVKAFNPEAKLIKTCPGDPPTVTEEPFVAGYLLHILWQKNLNDRGYIIFKGQQSHDQGDLMDFMNLLPPGTQLPQEALDALNQASSAGGTRRYTWNWALAGTLP